MQSRQQALLELTVLINILWLLWCNLHCWKILLILVLGKVASKTQYSHFVICKVWVLGFTHHFTLHPLIWQIFSLISWLYFSTMWILWGRKCDYWVFHITHAKKGLPNHSSSTRDLKDFFSICDVENTILTYPPHSILSFLSFLGTWSWFPLFARNHIFKGNLYRFGLSIFSRL